VILLLLAAELPEATHHEHTHGDPSGFAGVRLPKGEVFMSARAWDPTPLDLTSLRVFRLT
jgi:hypothetical protein